MASTIEQILKDNSTYITEAVSFHLGSKDFFNEEADDVEFVFPVGVDYSNALFMVDHHIDSDEEYNQSGLFQPVYKITALILKGYEPDNSAVNALFNDPSEDKERVALVNSCRLVGREFIAALTSDTRIPQNGIKTPRMTSIYNVFDSNLDGVMLEMKLKVNDALICIPKHSEAKPPPEAPL